MCKLKYFITSVIIIGMVSCKHNKLQVNEKSLGEVIMVEERNKEETQKEAYEKYLAEAANKEPENFRYTEDRSVDSEYPPAIIDIAGNLNNIKEFKLSQIASEITYIRLDPIPEPNMPENISFNHYLKLNYYLLKDYIVADNLFGIHLYSKSGKYIRAVVKNELTGVEINPDNTIIFWDAFTFRGGFSPVWGDGNTLYYNYSNHVSGQSYIMKYKCSSEQLIVENRFDPERPDDISGLGEAIVDLEEGIRKPIRQQRPGKTGRFLNGFFGRKDAFMLNSNSYAQPLNDRNNVMAILGNNGDTLSKLSQFNRLKNFTKSVTRGTDEGVWNVVNGKLFIRPEFNDTVFVVIPPNRFLPVYVLQLGNFKTSRQQGMDPAYKLDGKIIPYDWAETSNYVFLTFSKDDYDCPNTRKKKSLKLYYAIYEKNYGQLSIIKGDPYDYSPEILANDLDGGLPVWPKSFMIGNNGEIIVSLKGRELKERVASLKFKNSSAPPKKKTELEKFAASISDKDDILMLIR